MIAMIENTNMPGGWTDLNNADINELVDKNYGQRLKSGDNTTLRYEIAEGDREPIDLNGKTAEAVLLHNNVEAYRTSARLDPRNNIVFFHIDRALAPSATPYQVEIIVTDPTKQEGQADHVRRFPSSHDNERILLTITPSSANSDSAIIESVGDQKIRTIVLNRLDEIEGIHQAIDVLENFRKDEESRQSYEEARRQAEAGRVKAEEQRVKAEGQRQSNETERINNENNRKGQYSTLSAQFNGMLDQFSREVLPVLPNKADKPYTTTVSSSTHEHTITHRMGTEYPKVEVYMDGEQFLPKSVTPINNNQLKLHLGELIPSGKSIFVKVRK